LANDHIEDPARLFHSMNSTELAHVRRLAKQGTSKEWIRRNFGLSKGQLKRILKKR